MIHILKRFFSHQRELLAAAPGKYDHDIWNVTVRESPRFTFRWRYRHLRSTATHLTEFREGVWHRVNEDTDDLDMWVTEQINLIEWEKAYACN